MSAYIISASRVIFLNGLCNTETHTTEQAQSPLAMDTRPQCCSLPGSIGTFESAAMDLRSAATPALPAEEPWERRKETPPSPAPADPSIPYPSPHSPPGRGLPMGIVKLAKVIQEAAPEAVSRTGLQDYEGRIVAVDTSIAIYQLLTGMPEINNRNGENISLLQGLFFRTVTLLENGIKPVYVFDGRPPELKQPLLAKRAEASKVSRRSVGAGVISTAGSQAEQSMGLDPHLISDRATEKDCETLLRHLGVPCIQAPSEAEATCAALVASGRAWCTATEDMDALPFGSTRLVRHLTADRKCEIEEYSLPIILEKLKLTQKQFVDLCILLGCDYTGKIRGLGPKKALKLLQTYGSIEEIMRHTNKQKLPLSDDWRFEEARALFLQPTVVDSSRVLLEWREPDEEKLVQFLSHQKHMKEARVRSRMENMRKMQLKKRKAQEKIATPEKKQRTMGEFFSVKKTAKQVSKPQSVAERRATHSHSPQPAGS